MEILPITIAEPSADSIAAPADAARDGRFGKLLQASDERPDYREPEAERVPEPDRTAPNDRPVKDRPEVERPADNRSAAATADGAGDTGAGRDPAGEPAGPAGAASPATPAEGLPDRPPAATGRPTAKLPTAQPAPESLSAKAKGGQLTVAPPPDKTAHAGPHSATNAPGAIALPAAVTGHGPGAAPEPALTVAPSPQARTKPPVDSPAKGPATEPMTKPSEAKESAVRKSRASARSAPAPAKSSAEGQAPHNAPNVQQSVSALSGLPATGPRPVASGASGQPTGTTAAPLGPSQSVAAGSPALAEARPAAPPSGPPGGATEQVALRVHKAVAGGQERISIRLHPAELGRIEVKLAWSDDGLMRAMISADKGETLELLQRDQRALERTLQDAGIKTDSGSLNFDLRGHNGRGGAADGPGLQGADGKAAEDDEAEANSNGLPPEAGRSLHRGLLDLSV